MFELQTAWVMMSDVRQGVRWARGLQAAGLAVVRLVPQADLSFMLELAGVRGVAADLLVSDLLYFTGRGRSPYVFARSMKTRHASTALVLVDPTNTGISAADQTTAHKQGIAALVGQLPDNDTAAHMVVRNTWEQARAHVPVAARQMGSGASVRANASFGAVTKANSFALTLAKELDSPLAAPGSAAPVQALRFWFGQRSNLAADEVRQLCNELIASGVLTSVSGVHNAADDAGEELRFTIDIGQSGTG
jgi:hypothetical protein